MGFVRRIKEFKSDGVSKKMMLDEEHTCTSYPKILPWPLSDLILR